MPGEDVDLAVERQVIGVLGGDDLGQQPRAGPPLLDRLRRAARLVTTCPSQAWQAYVKRTCSVTNSEAGW